MPRYDIFTPPIGPAPVATQTVVTPRVVSNNLGGYKLDRRDGLFGSNQAFTLTWNPISRTYADAIVAFLDAHLNKPFYYALPREPTMRIWVWTQRQRTYPLPNHDALSVTIEERYDPQDTPPAPTTTPRPTTTPGGTTTTPAPTTTPGFTTTTTTPHPTTSLPGTSTTVAPTTTPFPTTSTTTTTSTTPAPTTTLPGTTSTTTTTTSTTTTSTTTTAAPTTTPVPSGVSPWATVFSAKFGLGVPVATTTPAPTTTGIGTTTTTTSTTPAPVFQLDTSGLDSVAPLA